MKVHGRNAIPVKRVQVRLSQPYRVELGDVFETA